MALPRLNDKPKYETIIPSTGKVIHYRPYLVKEEKVLMLAFESGDQKETLNAVVDTIEACIDPEDNFRKNDLTTFDVEYLFVKIRAKSVGETSTVLIKCSDASCEHSNTVLIDLEQIAINVPREKKIINVGSGISLELKWPSYKDIIKKNINQENMDINTMFEVVSDSIEAVMTENERIKFKEETLEERFKFIESLSTSEFQKITAFLNDIPKLEHNINFICEKCTKNNTQKLEGISSFF